VSSTATPTLLAPCASVSEAARTRRTPGGTVSPLTTAVIVPVVAEAGSEVGAVVVVVPVNSLGLLPARIERRVGREVVDLGVAAQPSDLGGREVGGETPLIAVA
jgi:hypothetical protein